MWESARLRLGLQYRLLRRGIPLAWTVDVPTSHPLFVPAQLLVVSGAIPESGPRFESLELQIECSLSEHELAYLKKAMCVLGLSADGSVGDSPTWRSICADVAGAISAEFSRYG